MKRHSWMIGAMLLTLTMGLSAQQPSASSGTEFINEDPPIASVEIAKPFQVRTVHGIVVVELAHQPIGGAIFQLRDRPGHVRYATSNEKGEFALPDVAPGTYEFKVTKNNFQSVLGKVIVSPRRSRKSLIRIKLPLGT